MNNLDEPVIRNESWGNGMHIYSKNGKIYIDTLFVHPPMRQTVSHRWIDMFLGISFKTLFNNAMLKVENHIAKCKSRNMEADVIITDYIKEMEES